MPNEVFEMQHRSATCSHQTHISYRKYDFDSDTGLLAWVLLLTSCYGLNGLLYAWDITEKVDVLWR